MSERLMDSAQERLDQKEVPSTFQSIFFPANRAVAVRVPNYQRAYSWEKRQIELFVKDLDKYQGGGKGYYFGHFIAEKSEKHGHIENHWDIVDGQQRITTFVLFLMVCRLLAPSGNQAFAYSLIGQFLTVSYDIEALGKICLNLGELLKQNEDHKTWNSSSDKSMPRDLTQKGLFTRSQRRMVEALLIFHQAFEEGRLGADKIGDYIEAILSAHCSLHLTQDKAVAVNIFEMHNTRGVALTTLEVVKAILMRYVYDHGGAGRLSDVEQIQAEFGEIYGMEERLAEMSFRGDMTMEQLLRLHLKVVDDGSKQTASDYQSPATNSSAEDLIKYVDSRLHSEGFAEEGGGVHYALELAKEFKKSVHILSETLPAWDKIHPLVGDVLILEKELSCQFFLIICRLLESAEGKADGRIGDGALALWEKLLFTRDFHGAYHGKCYRDDFPALFAACVEGGEEIETVIGKYLKDGFRPNDVTKGLQSIVATYLDTHRDKVLTNAFYWWKRKMIYAIYKYEISSRAKVREVMKGTVSVEHILPQEWEWDWLDCFKDRSPMTADAEALLKKTALEKVGGFIHGIGNLLLLTPGENTSVGSNHPAKKDYQGYSDDGSYDEHRRNREKWNSSEEWSGLIHERGVKIFEFMRTNLVDAPLHLQNPNEN